jgi:hypothetical protein
MTGEMGLWVTEPDTATEGGAKTCKMSGQTNINVRGNL